MKKHYIVLHTSKIDDEKLKSFDLQQERLNFLFEEHTKLKQIIKSKLADFSVLDPEYEILNEDLLLMPAILIACNEEMKSALDADIELSVFENYQMYETYE